MTDWKENIRDKMSEYSEAAPEGLLEDIMVSIDKENRRRRSVVITISSLAAAAITAVAVFMPDTRDRIESVPAVRTALSGGTDIIRIANIPRAGTIGSRKTAMRSETEGDIAGGRNETTAAADSVAGKKDVVLTDNDTVGNGNDANREDRIAGGREENGNTGMKDGYGWKDLLIAEAARPEKDRKIRMNLYAAGFAGSVNSYGGYSHDVAAMAAEAPMTYGENALAGILMMNRSKDISTDTRHFLPVKAGVTVSWEFAPRWSLESGITYSWLLSKSRSGSDSYFMDSRQTLHYIGIPLNISYGIWDNRWMKVYASAGGSMEKCVGGSVRKNYIYGNETRKTEAEKLTVAPLQWSVGASAGLQFNISGLIGIYLEPGLTYHFRNGAPVETVYSDRPLNFSLNLGLRFSFD